MLGFQETDLKNYAGRRRQNMFESTEAMQLTNTDAIQHERLRFGCFLTHIHLWKETSLGAAHYSVVLEDDVSISATFEKKMMQALNDLPENWDLMYLGSTSPRYGRALRKDVYQLLGALGTFGYAISSPGARKMLKAAMHSNKPIDHLLDSAIYTGKISAFHVVPHIVFHRDDVRSTLGYIV